MNIFELYILTGLTMSLTTFAESYSQRHKTNVKERWRQAMPERRQHQFGRRRNRPWTTNILGMKAWQRDVTPNLRVVEKAFIKGSSQTIFFKSRDKRLFSQKIQPSASLYDFKQRLVAVRTRLNHRKTCLLIPGSDDFDITVQEIMSRDGVLHDSNIVHQFSMAGDGSLTHREVVEFRASHPLLATFCLGHRGVPVDIVDVTDYVRPDSKEHRPDWPVTVFTVKGKVQLHLKSSLKID